MNIPEEIANKMETLTPAERAKYVCELARDRARALGAEHVIVMVGYDTGTHYVSWRGTGLGVRGLLEICSEIARKVLVSSSDASGGSASTK